MRKIYIVNATQVVMSESHPEGLYSAFTGYPKSFDSRSYPASDGNPNGDWEKALRMARADYLSRVSAILSADNSLRAMATVTLESSDGVQIMKEKFGEFPDMTPTPEPEPEPEEEQN